MKTIIKPAIIFIAALFVLASCGKYEEGPNISLRSKKARVANDWVLDEKYVNGEKQNLTDSERTDVFELTKDGKASKIIVGTKVMGTWEFYDDKEELKTEFTYDLFLVKHTETDIYTITRLKEKEMWLEHVEELTKNLVEYRYISK